MQPWTAADPRAAAQLGELRYAILARLAAAPATLHRLLLDLEKLSMLDEAPAPSLVDVVLETRLYKELGIIHEGEAGTLYLDNGKLPEDVAEKVQRLAQRYAALLGLETGTPLAGAPAEQETAGAAVA